MSDSEYWMSDAGLSPLYEGRARWVRVDGEWSFLVFDPPLVIPANHRARGLLPPCPFDADPAEEQPWHSITIKFARLHDEFQPDA
jgi:hypothetical protein